MVDNEFRFKTNWADASSKEDKGNLETISAIEKTENGMIC